MPSYDIFHAREIATNGQPVDMIIIPMPQSFGHRSGDDQKEMESELQFRASAAGLAGIVCPVWDDGAGRMGFIAPTNWHSYFESLTLDLVRLNLNRTLSW